ncbi:MAG: M20/M25/M40 family metallo-hydrolase [Candidatus Acidiferrales bacterium]
MEEHLQKWAMKMLYVGAVLALALAIQFSRGGARPLQAQAQKAELVQKPVVWPPEVVSNMEKVRDAAMASDYAWRQVEHLSENIGPRLSGSAQAEQAVQYVAGELRRLGLEVTLEKVVVPHWVRGEERGELTVFPGQAPGTAQKIVLTALGSSAATPAEGITSEVVVVNNFAELTALGRDKVEGRIVLYNEKFDKRLAAQGQAGEAYGQAYGYRYAGAKAAKALGAVASLIRSIGNADYRLPHTGASDPAGIPAAAVTAEDADLIADLARQGRVEMHLVLTPQTLPDAVSYNVIGDLKGSEHPEQIVVVSGHLDSWDLGTGAIDDGAGVALAMQTANLWKQLGLRPKRTLRVIAWMNEENGVRGGTAYAGDYKSALGNHVAAIESDSGAGHPMGFETTLSAVGMDSLQPARKVLATIGAGIMHESRGDVGTDISPMAPAGVPLFGVMQDTRTYFNYHHTAADTLDKIDSHELAENAATVAVFAYALADMPQPPR